MYVAPIDFPTVRHWFLNVNTHYDYLCMFLNGNGEYNDIINTEILKNAFLINRATGDRICYFFCSTFGIEGSIKRFNQWNVRNRDISESISKALLNRASQSELLREDVCDYYRIMRSKLPALIFINRKDEHFLYPIKSFQDIRALLTPLGILDDFQRDSIGLERELYYIKRKISEAESKRNKFNELKAVTKNAEKRSQIAFEYVCKIVSRCREYGFDEGTLDKMVKYPAKIRQILSIRNIDDSDLVNWLKELKNTVSQLVIVKENRLADLLNEISEISESREAFYQEYKKIVEQKNECKIACISNLKELNLALNVDSFMDAYQGHKTENWLTMLLNSLKESSHPTPMATNEQTENKSVLKCFIAGALALNNERNAIISGINDLNLANHNSMYRIECYSFSNFNTYISKNGQQYEYDSFIKEQADICVFILDNAVGGVTENEFYLALNCWQASGYKKPLVYVFSNKANDCEVPNESILNMRSHMNQHKQYWIDYSSTEVLKLKSQLNLQMLYKNGAV